MKSLLFALLACVLVGLATTSAKAQPARRSAVHYGWSSNYQESLATARRLDKPLMIVFRCIP